MRKIALSILVFFTLTLIGCSQQKNDISNIEPTEKSAADENQINANISDSIVTFGKAFVNLYTGAVAEQETVSFENYITNDNLLKFTNKVLDLEQRQQLKGGIGVIFGLDNDFKKAEFKKLDENLYYLNLPFSNQGSGMSCKLLVQSENKSLKIVDWYLGNKDGADTIATGHPTVRKLENPKLWDDQEWLESVSKAFEKYESELNS